MHRKRVCIIHQEGTEHAVEWAIDAIEQVSKLITADFDIITLGSRSLEELHDRNFNRILDGNLSLYRDDRVNCDYLVSLIQREFADSKKCGHVLFMISEDMYTKKYRFAVGGANTDRPAVVSTYRFAESDIKESLEMHSFEGLDKFIANHKECIKTVVMHELGHVLGVDHCENPCVMGPGKCVPKDWIEYTLNRQRNGPYCSECLSILISKHSRHS